MILQHSFQLTYYYFIPSYWQLHLQWWETHNITFTPHSYVPNKVISELNQIMLILKAPKITL